MSNIVKRRILIGLFSVSGILILAYTFGYSPFHPSPCCSVCNLIRSREVIRNHRFEVSEVQRQSLNTICNDPGHFDGATPLNVAIYYQDCVAARELLRLGASAVLPDRFGNSPLYALVRTWHEDCGRDLGDELIRRGAVVGHIVEKKRTLLHIAAVSGSTGAVEWLIDRGVFVDSVDEDGNTPLHLAAMCPVEGRCDDVIRILCDRGASNIRKNSAGLTPLDLLSTNAARRMILDCECLKSQVPVGQAVPDRTSGESDK